MPIPGVEWLYLDFLTDTAQSGPFPATPPGRTVTIPADDRTVTVPAET